MTRYRVTGHTERHYTEDIEADDKAEAIAIFKQQIIHHEIDPDPNLRAGIHSIHAIRIEDE